MHTRVALCLLASAAFSFAEPSPGPGSGSVGGRCLDENGAPLAGAEVRLYYNPFPEGWGLLPKELGCGVVSRTTSDAEGRFGFAASLLTYAPKPRLLNDTRAKPAGYYLLVKHSDRAVSAAVIERGKETAPHDIVLRPGFAQTMRTVSPDWVRRVPGVRIWLHLIRGSEDSGVAEWSSGFCLNEDIGWVGATTGTNGECIISNLPPVDCCFFATKEGYAATWRGGITAPNSGNTGFDMTPGALVTGVATLADGRPAARALIKFVVGGNTTWVPYAVTDAEGRFKSPPVQTYEWDRGAWPDLADLHNGLITVVADSFLDRDVFVASDPVVLDTKQKKAFQVALKVRELESRPLHLRILAPNGDPLRGYPLALRTFARIPASTDFARGLTADSEGRASTVCPVQEIVFEPRQPMALTGWYAPEDCNGLRVKPTSRGWESPDSRSDEPRWSLRIACGTGSADDPLTLTANVVPARELSGRVVDGTAAPVAGATVFCDFDRRGAKTDAQGCFLFRSLPEGKDVMLFAIGPDNKLAGLCSVAAAASGSPTDGTQSATISLEPTRDYAGEVTTDDGLPAPNLKFYMDLKLNDSNIYRVRVEPRTDAQGKFTAAGLYPKARYYAWWSSDNVDNRDYDYGNADVDLSNLKEGEPIRFKAKLFLNAVIGRVVNDKKEPIPGARVDVDKTDLVPQDERFNRQTVLTDTNGDFSIGRLAAGSISIEVSAKGYKARTFKVPTDTVDYEAVLTSRSGDDTIYGVTVKDPEGRPLVNVPVNLWTVTRAKDGVTTNLTALPTDTNGYVRFTLAPGKEEQRGWMVVLIGCDLPGMNRAYRGASLDEDADVEFVLDKAGVAWHGRVVDTSDNPVSNAEVRVTGMRADGDSGHRSYARFSDVVRFSFLSDKDGRFELERFGTNNWVNITIAADGYAGVQDYFDPKRNKDNEKTFRLARAGAITGRVVLMGGGAITGKVGVVATSARHEGYGHADAATNGTFSIKGLKPGEYTLDARVNSTNGSQLVCRSAPVVQVQPDMTTNATIELSEGIPVRGKLFKIGTKAPPAGQKSVGAKSGERYVASAQVTEDGSWTLYLFEDVFELDYYLEGMRERPQARQITVSRDSASEEIILEVK